MNHKQTYTPLFGREKFLPSPYLLKNHALHGFLLVLKIFTFHHGSVTLRDCNVETVKFMCYDETINWIYLEGVTACYVRIQSRQPDIIPALKTF